MNHKSYKGISPLVAVVALIGITLIISGIITSFATRYTRTTVSELQQCSSAGVIIQGARYESGSQTLYLYVKNRGTTDLSFDVLLKKTNGEISQATGNFNVSAGKLATFTLNNVGTDLEEVTIQSKECKGVQDLIQKRWITGMS